MQITGQVASLFTMILNYCEKQRTNKRYSKIEATVWLSSSDHQGLIRTINGHMS